NVTKFGAFVNILPGRDGLLHISKMGGDTRVERVEDVFELGDEVEVRVDDIDPNGKVSLSLVSEPPAPGGGDGGDRGGEADTAVAAETVSFEETFDAELRDDLGDLGPVPAAPAPSEGRSRSRRRRRRWGPVAPPWAPAPTRCESPGSTTASAS